MADHKITTSKKDIHSFHDHKKNIKHLISGALAGGISRTMVAPFERIIILKQTSNPHYINQAIPTMLINIYKNEGVLGLYKGNYANVLRIMPQTSIEFYVYEYAKSRLLKFDRYVDKNVIYLICGAVGGMMGSIAAYPLDLMKTLFAYQVTGTEYKGVFSSIAKISKTQGILALYKGLSITLMGIAPYASLKLTFYQMLKNWFYYSDKDRKISHMANLLFGAMSGCMAVTITYPTDLIRRKVQIMLFSKDVKKVTYKELIYTLYQKEGIRGFYVGLIATYIKVIPAVALTFMLNDKIKKLLAVHAVH